MQSATAAQELEPEATEEVANPKQTEQTEEANRKIQGKTGPKPYGQPDTRDNKSHIHGRHPAYAVIIDHKWFIGAHWHWRTNN